MLCDDNIYIYKRLKWIVKVTTPSTQQSDKELNTLLNDKKKQHQVHKTKW